MAIAVSYALEKMRFELGGGDIPTELNAIGILNQAGHHLYSMNPWKWAVGRTALLNLRGEVSGSTATWTTASSTLTDTGEFASYTFVAGDEINVTDGTGATLGVYKVASKTSSDAIVLDGSLSGSNLGTGDITWRIDAQTVALPTDLRDIIHIASTSISSLGGVTLTTLAHILEMRRSSASITASTGYYWGAVVFSGSTPKPILEIYPSPSANATGALRISYRSRWSDLSTDTSQIDIPDFVQDLFLFIARAYAAGYVRNDVASIHARLEEIQDGPIFRAATMSDGATQPYYGQLRGGGAVLWRRQQESIGLANMVEPPAI
jgi:hypothetical protein